MRALDAPTLMSFSSEKGGSRPRELRQALGFSLREFATLLGIPKSTLEDIEKGRNASRESEVIQKVSDYLEKTIATDGGTSEVARAKVKAELKRFLDEE
jgi:transcriptional regulator with XRE-family HTH domain